MSAPDHVAVVDTGLGNVASIMNMLRVLRAKATATADPGVIASAGWIILPGVGAFDAGMQRLRTLDLIEPLRQAALNKGVPMLGICLGMQLLTNKSEEGTLPGLGIILGQTRRIPMPSDTGKRYKLPHMGWNRVDIRSRTGLYVGDMAAPRFYFVHTYHVIPDDPVAVTATASHGPVVVTASVQRNRVFGAQFHPEKSHRYGLWLMGNFLRVPAC